MIGLTVIGWTPLVTWDVAIAFSVFWALAYTQAHQTT